MLAQLDLYTASNAPDAVSLERLAYMQGQRFWIERAFEDSKGSLGMSDYQLRKWRGRHHHMTLTLLAHLFLLRERIHNAEAFPLLSCQDIVAMLAFYLPKRDVTEKELFRQLKARRKKRQDEIERGKHKTRNRQPENSMKIVVSISRPQKESGKDNVWREVVSEINTEIKSGACKETEIRGEGSWLLASSNAMPCLAHILHSEVAQQSRGRGCRIKRIMKTPSTARETPGHRKQQLRSHHF